MLNEYAYACITEFYKIHLTRKNYYKTHTMNMFGKLLETHNHLFEAKGTPLFLFPSMFGSFKWIFVQTYSTCFSYFPQHSH